MIIVKWAVQTDEGGPSALFQRSRVGIGAAQSTGVVHNIVQCVRGSQSKVAVKPSQGDVAQVLERGKAEFHVQKSDRRSGDREDAG